MTEKDKNEKFEIASGVFICQVCKYYRDEHKNICLECKHLGDYLDVAYEQDIERKR